MDTMVLVVTVVNMVVSAVVAYFVARHFGEVAAAKFTRKHEQYKEIIDWLFSMKRFLEGLVLCEPPEEKYEEFHRVRENVERVVFGQDYAISGKALNSLSRLVGKLSRVKIDKPEEIIGGDLPMHREIRVEELRGYPMALSEVEYCFGVVRAEAKRDLRLK